jgi:hypothetical protein
VDCNGYILFLDNRWSLIAGASVPGAVEIRTSQTVNLSLAMLQAHAELRIRRFHSLR